LDEEVIPFGTCGIVQDGVVVDHQAIAARVLGAEAMDGDAGQHAQAILGTAAPSLVMRKQALHQREA
jgi:ABC-type xylose transport system permease subunit